MESILPWLSENPVPHIKNYYLTDSMYGCECYAYYDKYMVTAASCAYLAHVMADGSGIGRIHKKGAPSAICLSVPFPQKDSNYSVDIENPSPFALCGATKTREDGAPALAITSATG